MDYALFVEDVVVATKGDGVWLELESGSGFVQVFVTRHAAYRLARDVREALEAMPSNVTPFRHG